MSQKNSKTRISVTMTKAYLDAMDHLIDEGIYLSKGEVVLEALRRLLREQGTMVVEEPNKVKVPDIDT